MSDARALSCVISDAGRRWGAIRALLRQKYKYKIRNTNTKIYRKDMGCNQSYVETEIQIQKYAVLLVMSRILYMLPVYGGAPEYMLDALQKKQSEAMRLVTRRKWKILGRKMNPTKELLKQCNYHNAIQL